MAKEEERGCWLWHRCYACGHELRFASTGCPQCGEDFDGRVEPEVWHQAQKVVSWPTIGLDAQTCETCQHRGPNIGRTKQQTRVMFICHAFGGVTIWTPTDNGNEMGCRAHEPKEAAHE